MDKHPIPAVRAIIVDDKDRILLIQRANSTQCPGRWCLPGGKIDFAQTADEAVIREIREETTLEAVSVKFLFFQDNLPTTSLATHFITLYFKCDVEGEIQLNDESSNYAWVGVDEIDNYDIAFRNDEAIRKFQAGQ
jgi:8-oxo-dGTP diphosphatase